MTYAQEIVKSGRRYIRLLEIDIPICANVWSVLPCTASGSPGDECFQSFRTCQDTPNFNASTKTFRFCEDTADIPLELDCIPSIIPNAIAQDPTILDPAKTLGVRAKLTVTFRDHPYHDRNIDPYVANRPYDPMEQGTFWGKLLARVPNYEQRPVRLIEGFIDDDGVFHQGPIQHYVVEKINGPDSSGKVQLVAKDILKIAEDRRRKLPPASEGKLQSAINSTQTSFSLGLGEGAAYIPSVSNPSILPAQGVIRRDVIRIDRELLVFTIAGDVITAARGQFGTQAVDHSADATVQHCVAYEDVNVVDIAYDILTNTDYGAGINPSFIDTADWLAEQSIWLTLNNYSRVISKSEGVTRLLSELSEQALIGIWWDEREQKIPLRSMSPPLDIASIPVITDDASIRKDSFKSERLTNERITQIWLFNELGDPTTDPKKQESYEQVQIGIDVESESENGFGDKRERIILGTWLNDVANAVKNDVTSKTINKFKETPVKVKFELDYKESDIWTGSTIFLETSQLQEPDGSKRRLIMLINKAKPIDGTYIEYEATTAFDYQVNWARWAPAGIPDYNSASQEQRETYGFWADENTGLLPSGDKPYIWL